VDCRPTGGDLHYPAKVGSVNPGGSYDLEYDDGDKENSMRRPLLLAQAVHKVIAGQRARVEALIKRLTEIDDWDMYNVRLTDLDGGYGKLAGDAGSKFEPPKLKTMASSPTNKCKAGTNVRPGSRQQCPPQHRLVYLSICFLALSCLGVRATRWLCCSPRSSCRASK
jgi:hypothetical protein